MLPFKMHAHGVGWYFRCRLQDLGITLVPLQHHSKACIHHYDTHELVDKLLQIQGEFKRRQKEQGIFSPEQNEPESRDSSEEEA
eukprot:m.31079 g.31079  ORF g.31079 m.31079 type:complete len:84 (+) comp10663_c0_seq8:99-350(+)